MAWTQNELEYLRSNYGKVKIEEIEKTLSGRKRNTIQRIANRIGLKGNRQLAARQYSFNQRVFSRLSDEACYWAGFIAADGSIGKGNSVHICLGVKDIEHLQKFARFCSYDGPISIRTDASHRQYAYIAIWGAEKMVSDLKKHWNITPAKTLTLQPPNITKKSHILSYIAGYFDGDGTYFKAGDGRMVWGVCGNLTIIQWIKNNLLYWLKNGPIFTISKNGISDVNYRISCSYSYAQQAQILLQSVVKIKTERLLRKCLID